MMGSPPRQRFHVLVVDDHDDTRELLAAFLDTQGYEVTLARDGEEGLESAARRAPDAILLDYAMPRLSGVEFLERRRADPRASGVPVIGLTGSGPAGHRVLLDAGAAFVLRKPYDLVALSRLLDRVLLGAIASGAPQVD